MSSAKPLILAQGGCRVQAVSLECLLSRSRGLSRDPSSAVNAGSRAALSVHFGLGAGDAPSGSGSCRLSCLLLPEAKPHPMAQVPRHRALAARFEEGRVAMMMGSAHGRTTHWAPPVKNSGQQPAGQTTFPGELSDQWEGVSVEPVENMSVSLGQKPAQQWGSEAWRCLL